MLGISISDFFGQVPHTEPYEAYGYLCRVGPHAFVHPDCRVEIEPLGESYEVTVVFQKDYGERVIERAPYVKLERLLSDLRTYGPTFGPVFRPGQEELKPVHFTTDDSLRLCTASGELRLKKFLTGRILMAVPHHPLTGLRLLDVWPADGATLGLNSELNGQEWCSGRFLAVRHRGRLHPFRASNLPGHLGVCRLDDGTHLVLVPHALPDGDGPALVALVRVHTLVFSTLLDVFPVDRDLLPDAPLQVVWCDTPEPVPGPQVHATPRSAARRAPRRSPQAPFTEVTEEDVQGPPHPALVPLLARYLDDLAARDGVGLNLRQFLCRPAAGEAISPLMRALLRGASMHGRGGALWRQFESAGECKSAWHPRVHYYFLHELEDELILCRPCNNSNARVLPFGEFSRLDSPASRQLCEHYGYTPEQLLADWEAKNAATRSSDPPPPPPPPPPPRHEPPPDGAAAMASASPNGSKRGGEDVPVEGSSSPDPQPPPGPSSPPFSARSTATTPPPGTVPGGGFRPPDPARASPLEPEYLRFRPKYHADDGDIQDIVDEDDNGDDGDGSPRGPPGT
jgi:hypothetical protein